MRAADRVAGAKYPSVLSETSDKVGDGDITRGMPGIGYGSDIAHRKLRKSALVDGAEFWVL